MAEDDELLAMMLIMTNALTYDACISLNISADCIPVVLITVVNGSRNLLSDGVGKM
jgi:hypothetical protein